VQGTAKKGSEAAAQGKCRCVCGTDPSMCGGCQRDKDGWRPTLHSSVTQYCHQPTGPERPILKQVKDEYAKLPERARSIDPIEGKG